MSMARGCKQIRITFVQARSSSDIDWYPTLSYGYLKTYLAKNLPGVATMRRATSVEDMLECDVLAISSTSQDYGKAQDIARLVKESDPRIITVLGGHHVSYLPESMSEQFDIGVLGEGEETFTRLVEAISKGSDIGGIPGLSFHHEGRVITTPRRGYIHPVDSIPIPERDHWHSVYQMSSRGCPYKCSFCTSAAFWGRTRFFSAEYVVAEIEHILANIKGDKFINIFDDLFVADRKRLLEIISILEDKGLSDKVTFSFSVRANMVDDDMCRMINRLKIAGVCFGAESGSDRVLKLMNKNTSVEMNQRALDTLNHHGITTNCSFIVGWPTETEDEVRATYSFIVDNIIAGKLSTSAAINILMPMPGTPVWDYAINSGIIPKAGFNWNRLGVFASHLHSSAESFKDWVNMRRENDSIYMNEAYLPQDRLYEIMSEYETARAET